MESEIKSLTIISQQGTKSYYIGDKYNDLILYKIADESDCPPEGNMISIYRGRTIGGSIVFEVINAPIEVEYVQIPGKDDLPF